MEALKNTALRLSFYGLTASWLRIVEPRADFDDLWILSARTDGRQSITMVLLQR